MPINPYTGTANDPFQQAQHGYLGSLWERYFKVLNSADRLAPQAGGRTSLGGMPARPGDEDAARSTAANLAIGRELDTRDPRTNLPLDIAEHDLRGLREKQTIERASAIANTPGVTAAGRPITQNTDGSYQTGLAPPGDPRQVAAQMAPWLIAPPAQAAPRPVTFADPKTQIVNGKPTLTRAGSDGLLYDMARRPLDPASVQPVDERPKGPLETIVGPDGKPIRVRQEDAIGKEPAAGTMKASTGVQKRVLNFFNRAQQADGELEGMEAQIQELGLLKQGQMAFAPNFLQSQLGQSYGAAQRAFTEARLRKDSGAAIPDQEFANDRKTYFAQPGDSKETLEQKRRARGAMLASLGFESGQALGEFVGNEDEAKAIVQGYKDRAAGTKAKAAPAPSGSSAPPDGTRVPIPGGGVAEVRGGKFIRVE